MMGGLGQGRVVSDWLPANACIPEARARVFAKTLRFLADHGSGDGGRFARRELDAG